MRISVFLLPCVCASVLLSSWFCGEAHAAPRRVAYIKLADGFDFPVGPPDAEGYYRARGFRPNGHLGDDWNGLGGGDSDLGDPIYSIANGVVVFARDVRLGWGNVVIVRHAFRNSSGKVETIDSLYGHLESIMVKEGQTLKRGQQLGTMGGNRGMYPVHLHFEIRKNLKIGMARSKFARDFSNYYDPTKFIAAHRKLKGGGTVAVATNTFEDPREFRAPSDESAPDSGQTAKDKKKKKPLLDWTVKRFEDLTDE